MGTFKTLTAALLLILVVVALAYGSFRAYRWFNWTYGYKANVIELIHTEVKPECLRGQQ